MRILVLGGYGSMAQAIVRDLIESKGVKKVVIAGRDLKKAEEFAENLRRKKISVAQIDVTDKNLENKIRNIDTDVVINSTWYEYNMIVMPAVIEAGVHYVDLGGLYWKTLQQLKFDKKARRKNVTCILGMGSTPGMTNVMSAHAATKFDKIDKVQIRTGTKTFEESEFQVPYSIRTVLDEFILNPIVLRNGKIKQIKQLSGKETYKFKEPINEVSGYYTIHSELATMPRTIDKGVKEMDFVVGYDPSFTNIISTLVKIGLANKKSIIINGKKIIPYELLSELIRKLPKPKRDPVDIEALRIDCYGKRKGKKLFVRVEAWSKYHKRWGLSSGTVDTGIPPSIVAQWLAAGKISKTGVMPPEVCINPLPFFKELNARDRGIKTYEIINNRKPKPLF